MRIAIFGLWVFTMFEFLITLFRLDERAKAYFVFTVANVLVTIPVTVWLVVGEDKGASGLLWGQYGTGAVFLAGLVIAQRRRLAAGPGLRSSGAACSAWACRRCRPSSRSTRSTSSTGC